MGRAPCCEKVGLKKGPWTKDEDQILIDFIKENGHGNWRALPKKAGLLRCGKSCRLRWVNYLRTDIKRGNFTKEEEDAIIKLHEEMGNKWSLIAAKLPGRTDNEIKNVWHTHLKKKLINKNQEPHTKKRTRKRSKNQSPAAKEDTKITSPENSNGSQSVTNERNSPSPQTGNSSSSVTTVPTESITSNNVSDPSENFLEIDEDFWSDVLSGDYSSMSADLPAVSSSEPQFQLPASPFGSTGDVFDFEPNNMHTSVDVFDFDPNMHDDVEFWCNIFTGDGDIQQLLGI